MISIKLRGVNKVRKRLPKGGYKVYYYHRATGLRLPDNPLSPEFIQKLTELNAPEADPERPLPGSIDALIVQYMESKDYRGLADKTRRDYARYLNIIRENWGRNPVAKITREAILNMRDAYQDTPTTANYLMSVLRLILGFAVDRPSLYGLTTNPASRPKRLRTGQGHRPWEETEIAAFRSRWRLGTVQRTAFELGLNTGQRGEDIIRMARSDLGKDGTIAIAQEKTSARVWIPQSQDLKAALEAWDAAQQETNVTTIAAHRMLITNSRGQPFKVDNFRHIMGDAYARTPGLICGLDTGGVTTHGLRYTAATILHELGHDWETIAAITGHETVQMVRKYTDKKRRARFAIDSLNKARRGD